MEVVTPREILVKMGMAMYLHKKLAEDARKAIEAVNYLKEKGALK